VSSHHPGRATALISIGSQDFQSTLEFSKSQLQSTAAQRTDDHQAFHLRQITTKTPPKCPEVLESAMSM
jgi:hypothetical protein